MLKKILGYGMVLSFFALVAVGCGGSQDGYIEVRGSDTMVNLGQHWAEEYMEKNPQTTISVTGGGSGTGIAAIQDDNVDIAQSSRDITDSEMENAASNNVEINEFVVGQDGLAVVVHPDNPVKELTVKELKDIFTGKVTDWEELGWEDGGEISVYSRQSNSGTYVYFWENILDQEDWANDTKYMSGSSAIYEGISSDKAGIGYFGVGYVDSGVNAVNVGLSSEGPFVTPLESSNIDDGSYPIARPMYFYVNGTPEGELLEYLKWVLSSEGEKVLGDTGFYALTQEYIDVNNQTFNELGIE
ncbi:PstS family phosphate ABC transporter substrate-binding protein [Proteinivorax tanatarense]|uniref:Phosphate-binding protein n=1 Tax=Proteinivorax tanatarense TaxID=1260629 RepID=A0AAU7VJ28_9FIRM